MLKALIRLIILFQLLTPITPFSQNISNDWIKMLASEGFRGGGSFHDLKVENKNIYVCGHYYKDNYYTRDKALIAAKISQDGNYYWKKSIGGNASSQQIGYEILPASNETCYIAGIRKISSTFDIILRKFDDVGNLLWSDTIYTNFETANRVGITLDNYNNIYINGYNHLVKYNHDGVEQWNIMNNEVYLVAEKLFVTESDELILLGKKAVVKSVFRNMIWAEI